VDQGGRDPPAIPLVEIERRTVTRVRPGGGVEIVAELSGGPNGAALGSDGAPVTTNICFGGADLKTAHITLAGTGQLVAMPWPDAGLRLCYG
jgi:hypothetical protein